MIKVEESFGDGAAPCRVFSAHTAVGYWDDRVRVDWDRNVGRRERRRRSASVRVQQLVWDSRIALDIALHPIERMNRTRWCSRKLG